MARFQASCNWHGLLQQLIDENEIMNWKKIKKWGLALIIGNILLFAVTNIIYKVFTPQCFENILTSAKSNAVMMNRIGGYRNKETALEIENYHNKKRASFDVVIFGNSGSVTMKGFFQKTNGLCQVMVIDTIYDAY